MQEIPFDLCYKIKLNDMEKLYMIINRSYFRNTNKISN